MRRPMKGPDGSRHCSVMKAKLLVLSAVLLAASVAILESFQGARAANSDLPGATYSHGVLHVNIPYRAPHAGAGQLTVEVLDPEDQVLGSATRRVDVAEGKGAW